jgi:hypothetical protein
VNATSPAETGPASLRSEGISVPRGWWTLADQAELDQRTWVLVRDVFDHRATGCDTCTAGYPPCPVVRELIDELLEWRTERILASRAAALRAQQDRVDGVAA